MKIKSKKQQAEESLDYLKQVDKGGAEFVRKARKEEKLQDKNKQDQAKNWLEGDRGKTYREKIAAYAQTKLNELLEWAEGWKVDAIATHGHTIYIYGKHYQTKEGIQFIIKSPRGNVYMKGITMTYDPEIDMRAVHVLTEQAENSMDSEKGLLYETKGGIILPSGYKGRPN